MIAEIKEIERVDPKSIIISSIPKTGKSTIADDFTVNFKPGESTIYCVDYNDPYKYLKASYLQFDNPIAFEKQLDEDIESGEKIPYLFMDNYTVLDDWSSIVGTYEYMQMPQGKAFNVKKDPKTKQPIRDVKTGSFVRLKHTDKEWENVHTLPQGAGYRFSREVMMRWKSKLEKISDHLIIFVHVKDKDIYNAQGEIQEVTKVISLTGKLSNILPAYVNGIAHMYADGNNRYLDWSSSNKVQAGSTCKHLEGKMLISEMQDGELVTHWDKVYVDAN